MELALSTIWCNVCCCSIHTCFAAKKEEKVLLICRLGLCGGASFVFDLVQCMLLQYWHLLGSGKNEDLVRKQGTSTPSITWSPAILHTLNLAETIQTYHNRKLNEENEQ